MRYVVIRCTNGVVVFEVFRTALGRVLTVHCFTDNTTFSHKQAGKFNPQLAVEAIVQKAVALKGPFQGAFELTFGGRQ